MPGVTRVPSCTFTEETFPSTSAVTCTISSASSDPTAVIWYTTSWTATGAALTARARLRAEEGAPWLRPQAAARGRLTKTKASAAAGF